MLNIWLVEGNISITKANNKNIVIVVDATIEKEGKLEEEGKLWQWCPFVFEF